MRCKTLELNAIVLVLGIIVLGIEGIPNLFVVIILFVIVQGIGANKS